MTYTAAASLEEFVISAVASACNFERAAIDEDTRLLDIGMDSLNLTAVVAQIEAAYECELAPEQIIALFHSVCVGDVVKQVSAIANRALPEPEPVV